MNIKLDKNGLLLLQRGKEMKEQFCPFAPPIQPQNQGPNGSMWRCGDWCPLFHTYKKQVKLHCGSGLVILADSKNGETFTDERK